MNPSRTKPTPRELAKRAPAREADGCCADDAGDGAAAEGSELRCACGSLLARYVDGKVELKCRRCKRTIWIAVSAEGEPHA